MASFHYAYQKIVDLKASEKTQAEWLLSAAIGKLQAEEMTLGQLFQERASWSERLHDASKAAVALSELLLMQQYVDYVDACIARKQMDVKQAQRQVDDSRTVLSGKMMDEKVWQKSKERALDRFRSVIQTKEQNELDEMATVRFIAAAR
ncbi:flagellar export protein FliJ [Paenibacillus sepulcri]|uniref:Flagellar FliJ protein n=1 Tax=Paenibacillus sepulcri TaxID=359917 RepID=A0ABS7BYI3_9BACL|nr:flagellar export protein FliJ [Paenibacillus sepulcri]